MGQPSNGALLADRADRISSVLEGYRDAFLEGLLTGQIAVHG